MSETIEHFIASGDHMEAWCHNRACGHHQVLDMLKLRERLGPDHGALHDDIVPLLRCSKCGGKTIGLLRHAKGNENRNMAGAHNLSRMFKPKE